MDLMKLIGTEQVLKTSGTRKLTINGKTSSYPVYKIKLDLLYYNDQNDRIATWISQAPELGDEHDEDYNLTIQNFIVQSNREAINRTKNNIRLVDQREPGVVLNDGRLIDGNRRFTCLRLISAEDNNPDLYFEAVILDTTMQRDPKTIKMLELGIQHGEEQRVDYDLVDYAVGTYRTVVTERVLTEAEFAENANESIADVKHRIAVAKLLDDFLLYIKAPKRYHIVREMSLYSLFNEFFPLAKKVSEDEWVALKESVFNNAFFMVHDDHRKYIRDLKHLIQLGNYEVFLKREKDISALAKEVIAKANVEDSQDVQRIASFECEIADELRDSLQRAIVKSRKEKARSKPVNILEKANDDLLEIDPGIFEVLSDTEKNGIIRQIKRTEKIVEHYKGFLSSKDRVEESDAVSMPSAEMVVNKVTPRPETKTLFIRPKKPGESTLILLEDSAELTGFLNKFQFKLVSMGTVKEEKFRVCLVDSKYNTISDVSELTIEEVSSAHLEIKSAIDNGEKVYLCVKSEACGENEVDAMFEFKTNFIFDSSILF